MKYKFAATTLLAAVVGLSDRRYRTDLAAARLRLAQPGVPVQQVQTSAGAVAFVDLGAGVPVLVLHGNGGGWDHGVDWSRRRLGPGFRSISPSRFGYPGSSLPAGASPARQADVLVELLDQLGLDRVAVVSLSAGSITAAQLAARHPDRVRVMVLESPVLPTRKPVPQPPAPIFRALSHSEPLFWLTAALPRLVAAASGAPWSRLDADGRAELREILLTLTPVGPRADGSIFDNLVAYPQLARDEVPWGQVQAPTLVVSAADSPLPSPGDVAAVVARLPRARSLQLPSGGHLLLGNVARLRTEMSSFLGVQ